MTVDADRGLVISEGPLCFTDGAGVHPSRNLASASPFRFRPRHVGAAALHARAHAGRRGRHGTACVRREDIVRKVFVSEGKSNDESDQLDAQADFYLDSVESEYIEEQTLDVSYADLKLLEPDGLIHQVTWSIECPTGGTKTRASLATEHNPYVPRYRTRRQVEAPRYADQGPRRRLRAPVAIGGGVVNAGSTKRMTKE